ncbi:MAG: hypothetical protein KJ072_19320 [Verrucomicrobia bacterium]|nr:hypothetical protein [Verrucomicrobiota bacterium]
MRLQIRQCRTNTGNALLITMLTCLLIGVALASYLVLVSSQNYSVMRSLAWNSTIPILEAGAEEALTQLRHNGITNLSANGWVYLSSEHGPAYYKKRFMGDSYYEAYITPTTPPVVYSHGFVPVPLSPAAQVGMILASLANGETTAPNYLRRRVRIETKGGALFAKGMVAKGQIDLNGNNIATDSFDSSDPLYSDPDGQYPASNSAKTKGNGDVATNSGLINSLNVGNADIKGRVSTGPGGSVAIGPNGVVGSKAWVEAGNRGIQPGYSTDDMNVHFNDVVAPTTSMTPVGGRVDGVRYDYVLGTGNYNLSQLKNKNVMVTGNAVLHVTDSLQFTGNTGIIINPGGRLELYVSASSAKIAGNGVLNRTGNALNFWYLGLPQNTSLDLSGNAAFTGVIYAPSADFSLGGGGSDTIDFIGASITKTVKMNGHYNFHYDEALAKNGPINAYIVTSWNEL